MSISHAMVMTHYISHKINRIIQKAIVRILRAMNMLRDVLPILELHHMNVKLLSPNQKKPTMFLKSLPGNWFFKHAFDPSESYD